MLLPFDYKTLCVVALVENALEGSSVGVEVIVNECKSIGAKLGLELDEEQIALAYYFQQKRRLNYAGFSHVEAKLLQILDNPKYFPTKFEDYETIIADDTEMAALHPELVEFWKQYAAHVAGRKCIMAYGELFGVINGQEFAPGEYPTVITPMSKSAVIDIYKLVKTQVGFTPALNTPVALELQSVAFAVNMFGDQISVNIITAGGRICFEGE